MTSILIVEDDPLLANLYNQVFQKDGFETLVARDGAQGFEMATTKNPDFILLDMNLPKMNGLEVYDKILHTPAHGIPVIFLTNDTEKAQHDKAIKMGAKDYVSKAMNDPEEIVVLVKKYLGKL